MSTLQLVKHCQCYRSQKNPDELCPNPANPPDYIYCGVHERGGCQHEYLTYKMKKTYTE